MLEDATTRIESIAHQLAAEISVEIFDVFVRPLKKTIAVEIITDKPNGGITIDECTFINRELACAIEEQAILSGDYTVEVSSPGLDTPLKREKDFKRVIGREVHFYLSEKIYEKLEHIGKITHVEDEVVTIAVKSQTFDIPLPKINKAVQVIH